MSTRTDALIKEYLDRLRHELADLPDGEVDEIVQDLEPQLAELVDEVGPELSSEVLAERLGTPAAYASELRGAMGVTRARRPLSSLARVLLWVVATGAVVAGCCGYVASSETGAALPLLVLVLVVCWFTVVRYGKVVSEAAVLPEVRFVAGRVVESANGRRVVDYLTSVRPGWLAVRAGLVWLGMVWQGRGYNWWDAWPEVVATAVAVFSMVAGYRAVGDRRWLWFSVPLSGLAVGVVVKIVEIVPHLVNWGAGPSY